MNIPVLPCSKAELLRFLSAARKGSYAALGDTAVLVSPLLADTRQLEYRGGEFFYRDIYAGMRRFTGQEIVYFQDRSVWSMAYSGGTLPDVEASRIADLYAFLRQALLQSPAELPLRGPAFFKDDTSRYVCEVNGTLEQFCGQEYILFDTGKVYELHFCGGIAI